MKASVDKSGCIACGLCADMCPEVFRMGDDGLAEAFAPLTAETAESAKDARDSCPVSVIDVTE